MSIVDRILRIGEGRTLKRLDALATQVEALADAYSEFTDEELREATDELKKRYDAIERRLEKLEGEPDRLRGEQKQFRRTGGIHAAGAFTRDGEMIVVREDIGRHNAADKVIGHLLLEDRLPADNLILVMSSRASFELVQKAVTAGFGGLVAVSAASSLAVELAREAGLALTGFTRGDRFNLYSGELS